VGTLEKKEKSNEFQLGDDTVTVPESRAASLRALAGKRVRLQALQKGEAWVAAWFDEAAPQEQDLVIRGKVKNGQNAKRLRAALCSDARADPLFVTDVKNSEAVVRVALPAKGAGRERYWAVVWDDADGDGLPNEPGRCRSAEFERKQGKWYDKEELIESPVTVVLEIP
jgi:hypothetical protein